MPLSSSAEQSELFLHALIKLRRSTSTSAAENKFVAFIVTSLSARSQNKEAYPIIYTGNCTTMVVVYLLYFIDPFFGVFRFGVPLIGSEK